MYVLSSMNLVQVYYVVYGDPYKYYNLHINIVYKILRVNCQITAIFQDRCIGEKNIFMKDSIIIIRVLTTRLRNTNRIMHESLHVKYTNENKRLYCVTKHAN